MIIAALALTITIVAVALYTNARHEKSNVAYAKYRKEVENSPRAQYLKTLEMLGERE